MALTTRLQVQLQPVFTGSGLAAPTSSPTLGALVQLASGSGTGQADRLYVATRTIAASSNEDLDLAGVLTDPVSAVITFARVKALFVVAAAGNTNNVVVGAAAATQWATLLNSTGTVTLRPGSGFMAWTAAADATGWVVGAGASDFLRVANSGAGSSVSYDIAIVGSSA
jgi:hypothetical protein